MLRCRLQDVEPEEDYILVIDADMIMRSPFFPKALGVSPGAFLHWPFSSGIIDAAVLRKAQALRRVLASRVGGVCFLWLSEGRGQ